MRDASSRQLHARPGQPGVESREAARIYAGKRSIRAAMSPATPSFIATRLQQVAAELEDRHESALADLRGQLSQAEVEKMQSQLACLRMEAQLHEASTKLRETETQLQASRDECELLRRSATEGAVGGDAAAEAAQLHRISDLSRELIATRFELAEQVAGAAAASRVGGHARSSPARRSPAQRSSPSKPVQPAAAPASAASALAEAGSLAPALGASMLLHAAHTLDLKLADAILNPACIRATASAAGADAGDQPGAAAGGAEGPPQSGSEEECAGRCAGRRDKLAQQLGQALHAACRPISRVPRPPPSLPVCRSPTSPTASPDRVSSRSPSAATSPSAAATSPSAAAASASTSTSASTSASTASSSCASPHEEALRSVVAGTAAERAAERASYGCALPQGADATDAACAIIEALLLRGASLDATDAADGGTPLHAAVESGLAAPLVMMADAGARLDATDRLGRTALHRAASIGATECIETLMRRGADVDARDAAGRTPAELADAAGDSAAPAAAMLRNASLRLACIAKRANAMYRRADFAGAVSAYLDALAVATAGDGAGAASESSPSARAEKAVCSAADVATLHFNCSRAAVKQSRHVLALEQAELALEIRPDYANARMLQAECLMELLDFEPAAAAYRALASLEPSNPAWGECAAKAEAMASASAYEQLGVPSNVAAAALKRAYHAHCLQWHPDKHRASTAEAQRRANTMFKRITRAYETLSDERARSVLDMSLQADEARRASEAAREAMAGASAASATAASATASTSYPYGFSSDDYERDSYERGSEFVEPHPSASAEEIIEEAVREATEQAGSHAARGFAEADAALDEAVSKAVREAAEAYAHPAAHADMLDEDEDDDGTGCYADDFGDYGDAYAYRDAYAAEYTCRAAAGEARPPFFSRWSSRSPMFGGETGAL